MNRDQEGQKKKKNTQKGVEAEIAAKTEMETKSEMIHRDGDREIARETDRGQRSFLSPHRPRHVKHTHKEF